jgi:Tetratricopeptide repeat
VTAMNRALTAFALLTTLALGVPARAADENTLKAKEHFQKGQTHYSLGEFNDAVTEFREAFRLRNEPAILFNIGQSMRQLGNYKQAYFYYSQYLSKRPDAVNRSEVEGFMEAMKAKMDADEDADRARAQADAARPPAPVSPEDQLADAEGQAPMHASAKPAPGVNDPASKAAPAAKDLQATRDAKAAKDMRGKDTRGKDARTVAASTKGPASTGQPLSPSARPAPDPKGGLALGTPESASAGAAARTAPAASLQAQTAAPAAARSPDRWLTGSRIAGISAVGAGAVAGVLAVVFHGSAQSAANTLDQKYAAHTLAPSDTSLNDEVKSKGKLATISAAGCAVLLVSGAALTFVF